MLAVVGQPRVALFDLQAHVGDVQPRDLAGAVEDGRRQLGRIGVQVHLQRARVADDEDRVAEQLERLDEASGAELSAGDGEVGAEAIGAGGVLRVCDARRRVMLELWRLVASQRGDDAGEHDRQAVAAGIDDAGVAQGGQQLGAALDRFLAGVHGALERSGDQLILDAARRRRLQARVACAVRDVGGDLVGHLARDGQHRSLCRIAHGRVRAVGGIRERGADQRRVDQLARPGDELLGGASNQLREDHAGVAARAEQRRARDRLNDLLTPDLVDRARAVCALQPVELLQHGAQRQGHVVARIAIGDRKDVQVVDLLSTRFQVRKRACNSRAEADQIRIRHDDTSITCEGSPASRADANGRSTEF